MSSHEEEIVTSPEILLDFDESTLEPSLSSIEKQEPLRPSTVEIPSSNELWIDTSEANERD